MLFIVILKSLKFIHNKEFNFVKNELFGWRNSLYFLITLFERYKNTGNIRYGLITEDIIDKGAIVTTYTHDHHNLLVIGKTKKDVIKMKIK